MEAKIAETINSYEYPISTKFISFLIEGDKTLINQTLYSMEKKFEVQKIPMMPPLWILTQKGKETYL